jgi:hypothetical protein
MQTTISTAVFLCMGLTIFCVHLFEDLDVQGLIGNQLLEPAVFGLQLLQALSFAYLRPAILVAAAVTGLFADPVGTARIADLQPSVLDLPKDTNDLFVTVSVLHGFYGLYTAELSLNTF